MRPHKNLIAWKEAVSMAQSVYILCAKIPAEEKFGLVSQLKRAAVSVSLNIAEGAARKTKKEFIQFLYIAEGSLSEIDTIITICLNLQYLSPENIIEIENKVEKISALIHGLIKKLNKDLAP